MYPIGEGLIPAVILLIALFDVPSSYYEVVRIAVFFFGAGMAMQEYERKNAAGILLFIGIICIYMSSSILDYHLQRMAWVKIDIVCALIFIFYPYFNNRLKTKKSEND